MVFDEKSANVGTKNFDRGLTDQQINIQTSLILKAFNTWAFKRQQPTEPELLREVISQKVERQEAIEFALYWGKGPRTAIAEPDRQCLQYLTHMTQKISKIYSPATSVLLIQTDTHAMLNGHLRHSIDQYFLEVEQAAGEQGFSCQRLSSLIQSTASQVLTSAGQPHLELRSKLEISAAKWYRGADSVMAAAQQYYELNMIEKQAVQHACPCTIFITYNNSSFRDLFPERLPVFYMYSLRKGVSVKPWFLDANGSPEILADYNPPSDAVGTRFRDVA